MSSIKPRDIFDEILISHTAAVPLISRYKRLRDVLRRVVVERSASLSSDYSGLFSQLYAVCQYYGMELRGVDRFRARSYQVSIGEFQPTSTSYFEDLQALCEFVAGVYRVKVPAELAVLFPEETESFPRVPKPKMRKQKCLRMIVTSFDESFFYGYDAVSGTMESLLKVCFATKNGVFASLPTQLQKGCQVNLLSSSFDNGIYYPALVILEPDFLIDVSALTACIKPYGWTALNYLINKFRPRKTSAAILLGNAANRFMDDCINTSEPSVCDEASENDMFRRSMKADFHDALIEYVACNEIDKAFFENARSQFRNIREAIRNSFSQSDIDIKREKVQLEPSFVCQAMGLRGRFDLMTTDFKRIVELKSGKADQWGEKINPKPEHTLQTALYKEILYYNLNVEREDIKSFLFYSRYPLFYDERYSKSQIQCVMALRNEIVACELKLKEEGIRFLLPHLTVDNINVNRMDNRFFHTFLRPPLEDFVNTLRSASPLEMAYFNRFVRFIEKEQFLSKTGDCRPDSNKGFSGVWNRTLEEKLSTGDIIIDLKLLTITNDVVECLEFLHTTNDCCNVLPNFRVGDMVQLYERTTPGDNVTTRQVFRGAIQRWKGNNIVLRLQYKQRCASVFNVGSFYAIEQDSMESVTTQVYRGLFAFLTAPVCRRNLLLGYQKPRSNDCITLMGKYLNAEIDEIVLRAKQAEDYFLLIGPPGTGKTSVALRSMVEEFLLSRREGENLLLLAYTNRAVDEICQMLDRLDTAREAYFRIGNELSCGEAHSSRLLSSVFVSAANRREAGEKLRSIPIVVSTIASMSASQELFEVKHFSVAIIDEASQVLEPLLLPLLSAQSHGSPAIDKFVLVGDPNQLPAVVAQTNEESGVGELVLREIGLTNCRNSLFERLQKLCRKQFEKGKAPIGLLHRQGRMHTDICDFVNLRFYKGNIRPIPLNHQVGETDFKLYSGSWEGFIATSRMGFVNVDSFVGCVENNKINVAEAKVIARIAGTLCELCRKNDLDFSPADSIGIIVPFRGQISQVRKALSDQPFDFDSVIVDTVECFQGSQKDYIIFGTTLSMPYQLDVLSSEQLVDDVWVDRKFNVAITRARKQFFLVGNESLLSRLPIYDEYIKSAARER